MQPTLPEAQQLYRGVTPSMVAAFTWTHTRAYEQHKPVTVYTTTHVVCLITVRVYKCTYISASIY